MQEGDPQIPSTRILRTIPTGPDSRTPAIKTAGPTPSPPLGWQSRERQICSGRGTARGTDLASPQKGSLPGFTKDVLEDTTRAQALSRPYSFSYFLPGKLEGRPIQFLLDTGCTPNLINKQIFDRLPGGVRNRLEESDSHGLLADGTRLPFYGIIRLTIRLRKVKTEEVFVVSQMSEDAMLGLPFFVAHQCALEIEQLVIRVDGRQLFCTNWHGRLLLSKEQVIRW